MKSKMEIEITHFDRAGRVKSKYRQACDSFNYNFLRWLACSVAGSAVVNVIDTTNTARSISYAGIGNVIVSPGVTTSGIRVGTSGVASAPGDYTLGAMIGAGVGDNILVYGGIGNPTVETVGNTVTMHVKRSFINAGAVDITMRELDLVMNTSYNVQVLRDAVADQIIPSLDGILIDIGIQITV